MIKKGNISLFVLTLEIASIVVLHTLKMSQSQTALAHDLNATVTKSKITTPAVVKHYQLLSIK